MNYISSFARSEVNSVSHLTQIFNCLKQHFQRNNRLLEPDEALFLWERRKYEIRIRDNYTCRQCGNRSTKLQVCRLHHIEGKAIFDYPSNSLITVCNHCLDNQIFRTKHETHLLQVFDLSGFTAGDLSALTRYLSTDSIFAENLKRNVRLFANSKSNLS
ncbi:MAG: hypothetical protein WKF97_08425 [Chitinophagaceae bacterium]